MSESMPRAAAGARDPGGIAGSRPPAGRQFLDPAVIARLAHLDVRARLVVEGPPGPRLA